MDYKDTLNLPKTSFPMKANLPKLEPEMLKQWELKHSGVSAKRKREGLEDRR